MAESFLKGTGNFRARTGKVFRVNAISTFTFTDALTDALRRSFQNAKAMARAAQSNTRTAQNWLEGKNTPTARHLIYLMRESDEVFQTVMQLSGRMSEAEKHEVARKLEQIEKILKG